MKFGAMTPREAAGGLLAHAVVAEDLVLRKGTRLGPDEVARLEAAGVAQVSAAVLEAGDVGEDEAAARLGIALAGPGIVAEAPATGRVNLHAAENGVLCLDPAAIDRFNAVDEAVTLATLPDRRAVVAGEMVATVKIIPFAVAGETLAAALAACPSPALSLAPYRLRRVALISTMLPGLKPGVVAKTEAVLAGRLDPAGASLIARERIEHAHAPLVAALRRQAASGAELLVVFGAAAITDRRDTIPAALVAAGGRIERLGMPVDPGNLLLIGTLHGIPVIGAPGCARSPRENGFDWVLARLLAGLPVTAADIRAMGVGGLLMEIVSRPRPREPGRAPADAPPVAALILAAGRSSRMGGPNKLLAPWRGLPLVRHVAEAACASRATPVLVVTGHESEAIAAALDGLPVTIVPNPDHARGLSTSLRAGLAALPEAAAGALVLLGDMPRVTPAILDRLIAAFADRPEAKAVVPTLAGRRGNPVLLARDLFAGAMAMTGDTGARALVAAAGEAVSEVEVDDVAVLADIDTPDALAALQAEAG